MKTLYSLKIGLEILWMSYYTHFARANEIGKYIDPQNPDTKSYMAEAEKIRIQIDVIQKQIKEFEQEKSTNFVYHVYKTNKFSHVDQNISNILLKEFFASSLYPSRDQNT